MSWYGTCGVSQLPITYGDEVALFILKEFDENGSQWRNSTGGGFVYPDVLYNPVVPPVFGEYNDYGTINNIEDKGKIVYGYFKEKVNLGEKGYKIEEYIRSIERGKEDKYSIMLVHREVYEKVIKGLYNYEDWFTDGKTYGDKLEEDMDYYLKSVEEYVNTQIEETFKGERGNEELRLALIKVFTDEGRNLFREETQHYLNYLRDYKQYKQRPNLKEVILNFLIFKKAMEFGRKMWVPQSGAGSQLEYLGMAEIVKDFTTKKIKEYEEFDK